MNWVAPFDLQSHLTWIRLGIALVWLVFGLLFKALGAVPRHGQIVARVVGNARAGLVLWLVALAEIGLGVWMLTGRSLAVCMGAQTVLIITMNTLELRHARDLLLSPVGMVCANAVLLSLGWYVALVTP
jgi:DoxX-like protein